MNNNSKNKYLGGLRENSSPWFFTVQYVDKNTSINNLNIKAVCGCVYANNNFDQIIAIFNNKRGLDIPGGHLEKNETPKEAFIREVLEEAHVKINEVELFALLKSDRDNDDACISVYFATGNVLPFKASEEVKNRQFMSHKSFVEDYHGNKQLITDLLTSVEYNKVKSGFLKKINEY